MQLNLPQKDQDIERWFGETYYYRESVEGEKEKAILYLQMWKENLIFKLQRETMITFLADERYIETPAEILGMLAQYSRLSLKLCVQIKFKYEMDV